MFLSLAKCLVREDLQDAVVGIDLGTTFCGVQIYKLKDKIFEQIEFQNDSPLYKSALLMKGTSTEEDLLKDILNREPCKFKYSSGYEAQLEVNQNLNLQKNYYYTWKGVLGLMDYKNDKRMHEFDKKVKYATEQVTEYDKNNNVSYEGIVFPYKYRTKTYNLTPSDLTEFLLRHIVNHLVNKERIFPVHTVITTPAHYNTDQEKEVKRCARKAGLGETVSILKEPSAACTYFTNTQKDILEKNKRTDEITKKVLVLDVGGGTSDVAICELTVERDEGDISSFIQVVDYAGDNFCGGLNINNNIYDHFKDKLLNFISENRVKENITESDDSLLHKFFVNHCEEFKINLCNKEASSDLEKSEISMEMEFPITSSLSFKTKMTAEEFDEINSDVWKSISDLFFHKEIGLFTKTDTKNNINEISDVIMVGGSTRIPRIRQMIENNFQGVKIRVDENIDLAVSKGASLRALSIYSPETSDMILRDVCPVNVGVETKGGFVENIITSGTSIPIKKSKEFTTVYDGQNKIEISIYSGKRPLAKHNTKLGKYTIDLAYDPPRPRGVPRIEVFIDVDSNYKIKVLAIDQETKKEFPYTVEQSYISPNADRYKDIIDDAVKNEEEDKKIIEIKTKLDEASSLILSSERMIKGLPESYIEKEIFSATLDGFKKFYDNPDILNVSVTEINDQLEKLNKLSEDVLEAVKKQSETGKEPVEEKEDKRREL